MNKTSATILIVDDEEMIRESLIDILEDEDYRCLSAENADSARQQYSAHLPDLVLLDIWMPDTDGISLLREWQQQSHFNSSVIMMSGHGNIETAVEATKLGAYYFLEKPLSTSKLLLTIERALQTQQLLSQNAALKAQIDPPVEWIGKTADMQQLQEQARELAGKNVPLLITGKAGAGKQHLARLIHQHSHWRDGKFIHAPLAGMDEHSMLNALIGSAQQIGLIAQAEQGTLFLDEIAHIPAALQNLLLNLITEQQYFSGHSGTQQHCQIRIIAASRAEAAQLKDSLDSALYDQLTVAHLHIPALSEHSNDVPELLEYFSKHFADYEQLPYRHFSLAAQNTLRQHSWPGNVRELRNLVQRLLIQNEDAEISSEEAQTALVPLGNADNAGDWLLGNLGYLLDLSLREAREEFERQFFLAQFRLCEGNIAKLAGRVGMDRTNLYRKLRSVGIEPTDKAQ